MTLRGTKRSLKAREGRRPFRDLLQVMFFSALLLETSTGSVALAASSKASGPAGTMLVPLTPKIDAVSNEPAQVTPDSPAYTSTPAASEATGQSSPATSTADTTELAPVQATAPGKSGKSKATKTQTASAKEALGASPAGTLLLPLTPKIDSTKPQPKARFDEEVSTQAGADDPLKAMKPAPDSITAERGNVDDMSDIGEDTTLKGTVQIVADDTEFDQDKNTFLGTGNAVAIIAGQDSKLEADMILYDQNTEMMDARGNVRIFRNGQLTTGSAFKFKVTSDEYLITDPDTELQGSQVIARQAFGKGNGINFKDGTMTLPNPIYIQRNVMWGPLSFREGIGEKQQHPDAFVPPKQSFKFKARKMVYEKYKEEGNLTVFGGKLEFGKFSVPLGKFTATVGGYNSRVTFPVTPMFGNNLQVGGMNIGPSFNTPIGKTSALHWAPLIQFGGRSLTNSNSLQAGKLGLGGQVAFTSDRLTSHLAYGSVSNLLVGDLKYRVNRHDRIQIGINRYLDDGMFGYRRARFIAEAVDNRALGNVPFMSNVNFRTSAGFAQDNPQLINLSPQYAQLFGTAAQNSKKMTSGFLVQEQITGSTKPLFHVGNEKYGLKSYIYGGVALGGYSSGNARVMGQIGPVIDAHLSRFRLQTGYTQSAVRGSSPFVYDQFIQGTQSTFVTGDVRVSKYLTVGGTLGYNLVDKLAYGKTITAAIGPEDFKVILSRDMIRGTNRIGFDVLYGQPVSFQKMVLKGNADAGQLGGI